MFGSVRFVDGGIPKDRKSMEVGFDTFCPGKPEKARDRQNFVSSALLLNSRDTTLSTSWKNEIFPHSIPITVLVLPHIHESNLRPYTIPLPLAHKHTHILNLTKQLRRVHKTSFKNTTKTSHHTTNKTVIYGRPDKEPSAFINIIVKVITQKPQNINKSSILPFHPNRWSPRRLPDTDNNISRKKYIANRLIRKCFTSIG